VNFDFHIGKATLCVAESPTNDARGLINCERSATNFEILQNWSADAMKDDLGQTYGTAMLKTYGTVHFRVYGTVCFKSLVASEVPFDP
jgi:hypothetical protein